MKTQASLRFLILFFCLVHGAPSKAETIAEWKAALRARSADDTLSSAKSVALMGYSRLHHDFSSLFSTDIRAGIQLETGNSSSLFTDEYKPESKLLLQEASLNIKAHESLTLRAGALDQSHHESPLLIAGGTFPAALGKLSLQKNAWTFSLDAQQAIPTGENLTNKSTGKEATPLLFTSKGKISFASENFKAKLRSSLFRFDKLTRGIAQDSRFYGNTVSGIAGGASFFYEYQGYEFGGEISAPLSQKIESKWGASHIENTKGPKNNNRGLYGYWEVKYQGEKFQLAPRAEYYRNEADSSPAFYSSKSFGHNNRKGYGAAVSVFLPDSKLEFTARYTSTKLIEARTFQRDNFQFFELTVETPYDAF